MSEEQAKQQLLDSADQFWELPAQSRALFCASWQPFTLSRGDYLIRAGRVERYFYFINEGVLRAHVLHDANEISLAFTYTGEFSGAYDSFLEQSPAWFSIQALADCRMLRISHSALMELFDKSHMIERWGRIFISEMLIRMAKRQLESRSFSAEEKLARLEKNNPAIFQLVPLKYLASYIGMTPETLSRLRSRRR